MVHIRIIEKYAEDKKIPIMMKDGIEFLTKYIKENNIKNILEIGTAIGYSAIKMALVDEKIKIVTLEKDKERYEIAKKNIKEFNLEKQIQVINIDALEYEEEQQYDLIFIDAAKAQYIKFFEKYKKNLKQNGTIISDNLDFHGLVKNPELTTNKNTKQLVRKINKYIEFLKENKEFKTEFISLGDGIGISKKQS